MMIRQGDLALISVSPATLPGKPAAHTLAIGEDSGHAHVIDRALRLDDLLVVPDDAILTVEPAPMAWRHDPIQVPAGTYRIVIQREYTPQEVRRVQD